MKNSTKFWKTSPKLFLRTLTFIALCFMFTNKIEAQKTRQVTGTVSSSSGPLQGVSVTPLNFEKAGTTTNAKGNYAISLTEGGTLVFSSVGYKTVQIPDNGKTIIDLTMVEESTGLDDVVIIGYGTQKKSSLTSSVSDITGAELNKRPVANASQALQGLAAGVTVIDGGGSPGKSNATIRIRGITSLVPPVTGSELNSGAIIERSGLDPLYIIDGIE